MKVRGFLSLAVLSVAAFSPAIVIDTFSDGDISLVVSGGAGLASLDPATVLGGSRATWIGQQTFTGNRTSTLDISAGAFSIDNSINTSSASSLGYGVDSVSNSGTFSTSSNLSFNLAGLDTFRFFFEGNDQALTVEILLVMDMGNGVQVLSKNVAGSQFAPFVVDLGAADIVGSSGTINYGDIDQLRINFYTSNAGDFALDKIEAVPEPATMAVLGLGVAALARRRRK